MSVSRLTWRRDLDGATDVGLRDGVTVGDAICRLADIESILGDGYDLDRLRELSQADRDGMLMVLPCKVGALVWLVDKYHGGVYAHEIRRFERNKDGDFAYSCVRFPFADFGKAVFLTREEAEAALGEAAKIDQGFV